MIRIIIADDSPTDTLILKNLFESEPDMVVVACAKNGREALEMIEKHHPDLVTMDIEMPFMNGYETTKIIMTKFPTPVVMISSHIIESESRVAFEALAAGALTVLPKPRDIISKTSNKSARYIIDTVRNMSEIRVIRRSRFPSSTTTLSGVRPRNVTDYQIVAIGTSVGGPQALKLVLSKLPANFPLPIVIVQHMTPGFMPGFVNWLSNHIKLKVKCAEVEELLQAGTVYFAPDYTHFMVQKRNENAHVLLQEGDPVAGFCPSITMLMKSVAKHYNKNAIAILLTGMGTDGVDGFLELKQAGAHTLIQDESSCVVFGMGAAAKALGSVDKEVKLNQIANYLLQLIPMKHRI